MLVKSGVVPAGRYPPNGLVFRGPGNGRSLVPDGAAPTDPTARQLFERGAASAARPGPGPDGRGARQRRRPRPRGCFESPAQHPQRPARTLTAPAKDPSSSATRAFVRRAEGTHQTPRAPHGTFKTPPGDVLPGTVLVGTGLHGARPDTGLLPARPQAARRRRGRRTRRGSGRTVRVAAPRHAERPPLRALTQHASSRGALCVRPRPAPHRGQAGFGRPRRRHGPVRGARACPSGHLHGPDFVTRRRATPIEHSLSAPVGHTLAITTTADACAGGQG